MSAIDFEKFARYSRPGPRYTSYPTAVEFHEGFNENAYLESLQRQSNDSPLSLYVHLPFCRSACYFCGCNVVYTSKEDKKERYLHYLKKELGILARHIDSSRPVVQLHFGGGTPTFHSPEQLAQLIGWIRDAFPNFTPDAEIGCEIDPRYFSEAHMKVLQEGGFNRLSFGVQDFDEKVQEAVHRQQSTQLVADAVAMGRAHGVTSINFDLIYGLPYQTLESFQQTLHEVLELSPDRLAIFNYAHVPWMKKTMRKIDETTLPAPDVKLRTLQMVIDMTEKAGYRMIGMDHFAKPDDPLSQAIDKGELHRNFQGYTTRGGSTMIGIGLTSIGEGADYYVQNYKEMEAYERALDADRLPIFRGIALTEDDRLRKMVIMEMMSNFKLEKQVVETRFGIDFDAYFAEELIQLQEHEEHGLLTLEKERIVVHPTGTMLIRNLVMPFDAHLKKLAESERRFSKTV